MIDKTSTEIVRYVESKIYALIMHKINNPVKLTLTHAINNFHIAIIVYSSTEGGARKYRYASEASDLYILG